MSFQQLPHTAHPSTPMQILMALRNWFRREIVDDDPWDTNTLLPTPDKSTTAGRPNPDKADLS
ncbi:MAG TPA: hypothetical protein IGS37_19930 [Synechococcales cyanobacterium M55_K2018_004]|nr:hypothetical protein [Synechococcales cyanobacterium M55_K2018_004]